MGNITLLPCPFCGGRAELKRGVKTKYVMCLKCETFGPNLDDEAELARHWNQRALSLESVREEAIVTEAMLLATKDCTPINCRANMKWENERAAKEQLGEQNAAPQVQSRSAHSAEVEIERSAVRTITDNGDSASVTPAAAAPDAAATVKRLNCIDTGVPVWNEAIADAAALIEKLGQGWAHPVSVVPNGYVYIAAGAKGVYTHTDTSDWFYTYALPPPPERP